MTAILPFLLRNWQAVLGGAIVAALAVMLWVRTDQRDDAREGWEREKQAAILFAERVRATSEEIQRRALENARRVETEQARISQESQSAYETRIADLRARVERMRVNQGRAGAGGGRNSVPGVPEPARLADGAAEDHGLSATERIVATEQAVQLDELQNWLMRVQGVER